MRILAITDAYYPSRLACAVRMKVLVEVLRKYGHDVQVLASDTSLSAAASDYLKPDYVHFFPVAVFYEEFEKYIHGFSQRMMVTPGIRATPR